MTTNYEMRPSQGSLFRNRNKTRDEQPGYTGKVMLPNGEVRYLSVWVKRTKANEPWFSLSIGELVKDKQQAQGMVLDSTPVKPFAAPVAVPVKPDPVGSFADMEDDLPF
jgi:hypothetical protein